ncbi:MAG: HEPN domain-containing protein [Candidatus Magnetobacterium sp. LHC-1]|uniref:HEPN domain-containing protein n=1 Tax=Candidatus Magnetobacterium casense TaxID=1455061 RepID=A0ABS6RU56_9BACT|nr:HEPN domain-containing protein [Candidatus Magnetobacterium casensis]MBF0606266.1 HEPN domain-containing protein [Nitrospirota bacterium]MBV6340155.1 HEPN domain-containing protein [Candidatus Magnetobacterium casensis]
MTEAEEALQVAQHLFEKEDYSYSLFFGHIAIEKISKTVYVNNRKEHAPFTHNLSKHSRACRDFSIITSKGKTYRNDLF